MSGHEAMMRLALAEAQKAFDEGEIPCRRGDCLHGSPVAFAHNLREQTGDPTAHAEILVIREAARALGTRRLNGCTLYVTLEPCPMCAGALTMACVGACYFGARDERQGALKACTPSRRTRLFTTACHAWADFWRLRPPRCSPTFLRPDEPKIKEPNRDHRHHCDRPGRHPSKRRG